METRDNIRACRDLYGVIGVSREASRDTIEQACLRLAEKLRPDKNPGDLFAAKALAEIETAYETLTDSTQRAAYDHELSFAGAILAEDAARDDWDYYRAAIGKENTDYYIERFQQCAQGGAFRPGWNWAAFAFGMAWILHRNPQAQGASVLYLFVALAIFLGLAIPLQSPQAGLAGWAILSFGIFPIYANGLYFLRTRGLVEKAKRSTQSHPARIVLLQNDGMPAGKKRPARLIELMIVVAIIGILASLACGCSGYTDYGIRTKCSDAILACAEVRAQVVDFALKNGRLPTSMAELDMPPLAYKSKYLKSVELNPDATIVAKLQGEKEIEGMTLIMRPTLQGGAVTWICGTPDGKFNKYVPGNCRNML